MRTLASYGALALALATAPAMLVAQETTMADASTTMGAEHQAIYDGWPAERRSSFDSWPVDYRTYYWTLSPNQQTGYWALTNEQRATIAGLSPEQRLAIWASIEQQMAAQASGRASSPTITSATVVGSDDTVTTAVTQSGTNSSSQMTTVMTSSGNYTPPPATAMIKDYPLCSRTVQDSCINPREAGKNFGNRPLGYWPGRPASETRAPGDASGG